MADATPETARLTVDVALFATDPAGHLHVLLIRRAHDPHKDCWALPGGRVNAGEDVLDAAHRELQEETGVQVGCLTHVGVYHAPGRDPRGRYVTFVFTTRLGYLPPPAAADDAADARWVLVCDTTADTFRFAFDHALLMRECLKAAGR